jgi:acyl-CoA hydrolase
MIDLSPFIPSGSRVFIHGGCATPQVALRALQALPDTVTSITLYHLHTEGPLPYLGNKSQSRFRTHNLFVGANIRGAFDFDQVDYIPCFLSEIGLLFRKGILPLDVGIFQVSPPDAHGWVSLGLSVDVAKAAFESAKVKLLIVNPNMPRTHGDSFVSIHEATQVWQVEEPLPEVKPAHVGEAEQKIATHIAALIEDGSTIQTGIGCIPAAVWRALGGHKDLGVHTEMWTEDLLPLLEKGVVTNRLKKVHPGKTVCTFAMGGEALRRFVHDNPSVVFLEASYVNQPNVIARNPKVVAINSCVEMDLTGQVCADSVGPRIISGVGGQMDFMRGAFLSEGGKPIMAFTSRSRKGVPRLVAALKPGAGVVTTRAHVHYVVTEWGVANLVGLSLSQRAKALINLAHPEDRETLERDWWQLTRGQKA